MSESEVVVEISDIIEKAQDEGVKMEIGEESILYVPIGEDGFISGDLINSDYQEQTEGENYLSDHNYHNSIIEYEASDEVYLTDIVPQKEQLVLQCPHCDKMFSSPTAMTRHMRTHTGEQPYRCQLCDKCFSQQSNLWKHVLIHTGERRFECPMCKKKFSQRANMQKHMRVHTGEKPFQCNVCGRGFTQRANLNKHERIHTGERPYSCKYCSRSFAQLSNMQKHQLLHEGIKPYSCPICFLAFTQQSNLKKHMEVHNAKSTKNVCGHCHKSYSHQINLLKHLKTCGGGDKDEELDDTEDNDIEFGEEKVKSEVDYKDEDTE